MMNTERPAALWPVTTRRIGLGISVSEECGCTPPSRRQADPINRIADYIRRSTIIRLISAMALAGLRCLGQALAQFMMVWQRERRNGFSGLLRGCPAASARR